MKCGVSSIFRNQKSLSWIVLLCITISIGGCSTVPMQASSIPYQQSSRIQYLGFSILPPQGEGWVAQKHPAGSPPMACFGRSLSKQESGAGAPHTVVATVSANRYPNITRNDRAALLNYLIDTQRKELLKEERYKPVSFEASEDTSTGHRCIKWSFTVEDRGVPGFTGEVFMLGGWGLRCAHPEVASLVVDVFYTQRFRQGGQWMTALDTEAESFLKSLRFTSFYDSDDPRPLVIQSLEDYAVLLREKSQETEAKKIEQWAKVMAQTMQASESTFLGFNPSEVLREYSALLHEEGMNKKAKAMNSLADSYQRANAKAATRKIEEYKKKKIHEQE